MNKLQELKNQLNELKAAVYDMLTYKQNIDMNLSEIDKKIKETLNLIKIEQDNVDNKPIEK